MAAVTVCSDFRAQESEICHCFHFFPICLPWRWERLKAGGEGNDRGWDGWMASLTEWTWIWANSGRQWRTGEPGVLQFMGSQGVRHDLATEQQCDIWFHNSQCLKWSLVELHTGATEDLMEAKKLPHPPDLWAHTIDTSDPDNKCQLDSTGM